MIESFKDLFQTGNPYISILAIAIAVVAAIIVHFLLFKILEGVNKQSGAYTLKVLTQKLKGPALFLFILLSLKMVTPFLKISAEFETIISQIAAILIIIIITWFLIKVVAVVRVLILRQYDITTADNLEARKIYTQMRVLERILIVLIIIIGFASALMTFEKIQQIGYSLLASAGVAGIIIGFAAQKSIATILAGFQIAMTQPIRIEDVVIVEGEWGRIEEITLTYVVVRIWDKRRLIVPITYFIEKPFQNWTRVSADLLGTVYLYTDYRVPTAELRKQLTRLLKNNDLWDGEVDVLQVTDSTNEAVEIRALMSCRDSSSAWDLRVYIREKMIEFLQKNYPDSLPRTRVVLPGNDLDKKGKAKHELEKD